MYQPVKYIDLGLSDYKKVWDYQETLFDSVVKIKISNRDTEQKTVTPNYLIFCEHPHVFTLGKSGSEGNLLVSEQQLKLAGLSFYKINRGGDITYHGPGQIVVYPIIDLENFGLGIHSYVEKLEEVVILTLSEFGITSGRLSGASGVWIDSEIPSKARKICALGVRASHYVTMHGIAFNVNTDLSYFQKIIPCGIPDKKVTSLSQELSCSVNIDEVKSVLKEKFSTVFKIEYY